MNTMATVATTPQMMSIISRQEDKSTRVTSFANVIDYFKLKNKDLAGKTA
ncbi:MAG: hypothetical protein WB588_05065 [Dehalococcoidia bacterium]